MITLQYCVLSNLLKKYLNEIEKKKDTQTVEGHWLPNTLPGEAKIFLQWAPKFLAYAFPACIPSCLVTVTSAIGPFLSVREVK